MADDITPIRPPKLLAEVGGMVDESRVTLAIYGEHLDIEAVSSMLGCAPTHAHRKGERRPESSMPYWTGAWLLTIEGKAPQSPDDLIRLLVGRFPSTPEFWRPIAEAYSLGVRVGIHTGGWNRGFELSAETLAMLSRLGGTLGFDLYFYGDGEVEGT
jgi:hypothetical protein